MARFKSSGVNENAVIGGRVCVINEAEEPTEILWANIDSTLLDRHVLTTTTLLHKGSKNGPFRVYYVRITL